MQGIGAAIIPTTTQGGGGGTGAVDKVVINVNSPTGTVSQPTPSTCQVIDGTAIVEVKLDAQQGQQNALKGIQTKNKLITPDQVTGIGVLDAADIDVYTKEQTDEEIAPVAQDASDAKDLADQANTKAGQANTTAQQANTKATQALEAVNQVIINLNKMQGKIVSNTISGTLTFNYETGMITLVEDVDINTLPFVKSVAGALPDPISGDAKPTPEQLDTYSQQQIDDEFSTQQNQITQTNTNLNNLILKYNAQTGEITSPDGTVVGSMTFTPSTGKWVLSLRSNGGGTSTIIDSDNLDVIDIPGGYKINLNINPAQLQFINKILNVIGGGSGYTPDGTTIVANAEKVMSIAPDILAEIDEALMTAQQIDEELIFNDTIDKANNALDITQVEEVAQANFETNIISIQEQITNNKLIIDNVFINKINNGSNVNIAVNSETNTATISATGGSSGGATKVTVTINGANPKTYNVDGNGNITIDIPITANLQSNLLDITTKSGKTDLHAIVSTDFNIGTLSKELELSTTIKADIAKGVKAQTDLTNNGTIAKASSAVQDVTATGASKATRTGNNVIVDTPSSLNSGNGYPTYNFDGDWVKDFNPAITPNVVLTDIKKSFPSKQIVLSVPKIVDYYDPSGQGSSFKFLEVLTCLSQKSIESSAASPTLKNGDGVLLSKIQDWLGTASQAMRYMVVTFATGDVSFLCSLSNCPDFTAFATFIQNSVKTTIPTFTCIWNGTNFVMNSNNAGNKITYSARPTGNSFPELMKVTQYIDNNNQQVPSGATLTSNMSIALSPICVTRVLYDTSNPPTSVTVNNEWLTVRFDPRVIYNNQANCNSNQALITITASSYSNGIVLASLPNRYIANYSFNGSGQPDTWWTYSNQLAEYGILLAVQQQYIYYAGKDLNAGGGAGDLVVMTINMALNQFMGDTWSTQLMFIGQVVIPKIHTVRLIINCQDAPGVSSPYTINGLKTVTIDIKVPATGSYPIVPLSQNNAVVVLSCNNNAIIAEILDNNANNSPLAAQQVQQISYVNGESDLSLQQQDSGIRGALVHHWQGNPLVNAVDYDPETEPYGSTRLQLDNGYVYTFQIAGAVLFSDPFINNNSLNIGLFNEADNSYNGVSIEIDPNIDNTIAQPFGTVEPMSFIIDTTQYDAPQIYRWQKWVNTAILIKKTRSSHKKSVVSGCWSVMASCFNVQVTRV